MTELAWKDRNRRTAEARRKLQEWDSGDSFWTWLLAGQSHEMTMAQIELGDVAALYFVSSPYDTPQFDDELMYWERPRDDI